MTDSDYQNPTLIPASTSINGALTVQANLADAIDTSTVFIKRRLVAPYHCTTIPIDRLDSSISMSPTNYG